MLVPSAAPIRAKPLPPWPILGDEEVEAAARVLRSGVLNAWLGDETRAFEEEFAAFAGVRHAIALTSGTTALEAALHGVGVGPGDDVVIPCRSFVAIATSVVARGARPVFADVDPDSGNVTAETLEAALTPRTRALMVVHVGGWPCEMDAILDLARRKGLAVVEDAAPAPGATYKGRRTGGLGHVGVFSTCQDKILTTGGEGGVLVTDDEEVWRRAWSWKEHGKSMDAVRHARGRPGFAWVHESFGTNARLTEMQSAIGRVQLRKVPEWLDARRRNARLLTRLLADAEGLRTPQPPPHVEHAYDRYYAYLLPERLAPGWSRDRVVAEIRGLGIPCYPGACPEIYLEPAFRRAGFAPDARLPAARRLGETSLALLVHPSLEETDLRDVAAAVKAVMARACA